MKTSFFIPSALRFILILGLLTGASAGMAQKNNIKLHLHFPLAASIGYERVLHKSVSAYTGIMITNNRVAGEGLGQFSDRPEYHNSGLRLPL